jgi:hypothetical protein
MPKSVFVESASLGWDRSGKLVTSAGMFTRIQCHQPLSVGASGSNIVTAKLFVSGGASRHCKAGEIFCPSQPKLLSAWRRGIIPPFSKDELVISIASADVGNKAAAMRSVCIQLAGMAKSALLLF